MLNDCEKAFSAFDEIRVTCLKKIIFGTILTASSMSYNLGFNDYSGTSLDFINNTMSAKDFLANITSFSQIWKMMDLFLSGEKSKNKLSTDY